MKTPRMENRDQFGCKIGTVLTSNSWTVLMKNPWMENRDRFDEESKNPWMETRDRFDEESLDGK